MTTTRFLAAPVLVLALSAPAMAAEDFSLTYHVERLAAADLSLEDCSTIAAEAAGQAGLESRVDSYPGQLAVVAGGARGAGAFVVQCIAVDDKTVTVVQGIDYAPAKGDLGAFADSVHAALLDAAR